MLRSQKISLREKKKGEGGWIKRQTGICCTLDWNRVKSTSKHPKTFHWHWHTISADSCLGGTCYNQPLYFWPPSWWKSGDNTHTGSRTALLTTVITKYFSKYFKKIILKKKKDLPAHIWILVSLPGYFAAHRSSVLWGFHLSRIH